jgi:hypothetical protein
MHAPQGAFLNVVRDVALNQPRIQAVLLELPHAEASGKKPPFVLQLLGLDEVGSFQYCFFKKHNAGKNDLPGSTGFTGFSSAPSERSADR